MKFFYALTISLMMTITTVAKELECYESDFIDEDYDYAGIYLNINCPIPSEGEFEKLYGRLEKSEEKVDIYRRGDGAGFAVKKAKGMTPESSFSEIYMNACIRKNVVPEIQPSFGFIDRCYDVDGDILMVMNFVPKSLDKYIVETGGIKNVKEKERIMIDLSQALRAMHSIKFAHGDIKNENIMISEKKRGILLDFGMSYPTENPSILAFDVSQLGVVFRDLLTQKEYDSKYSWIDQMISKDLTMDQVVSNFPVAKPIIDNRVMKYDTSPSLDLKKNVLLSQRKLVRTFQIILALQVVN